MNEGGAHCLQRGAPPPAPQFLGLDEAHGKAKTYDGAEPSPILITRLIGVPLEIEA